MYEVAVDTYARSWTRTFHDPAQAERFMESTAKRGGRLSLTLKHRGRRVREWHS